MGLYKGKFKIQRTIRKKILLTNKIGGKQGPEF